MFTEFGQSDADASEVFLDTHEDRGRGAVGTESDTDAAPKGGAAQGPAVELELVPPATDRSAQPTSATAASATAKEAPPPAKAASGITPWRELRQDAEREVIVRCVLRLNARFWKPTEVAEFILEHFSVQMPRRDVEYYDPTKQRGAHLAARYKLIFLLERQAYETESSQIPLGSPAYRLECLSRIFEKTFEGGQFRVALDCLA